MVSLDIIIGHFLPNSYGWIFLIFVLVSEGLLLSKYLTKSLFAIKVFACVFLSNLITTVVGYFLLDTEKIGGHLLNWIPINHYYGDIVVFRTIFVFVLSFVGTILIETLFNLAVLRKISSNKNIISGTILVNTFTYAIAAIVIFHYITYRY